MKKIQPGAIGLFVLIVVIPGISWFFLQKGLNYSKDIASELAKVENAVPEDMNWPEEISKDSIRDRVVLVLPRSISDEDRSKLAKIKKQFETNPNLVYIDYDIKDTSLFFEHVSKSHFSLKDRPDVFPSDHFVLLDENGILRMTYIPKTNNDWKRLVKHLAFTVPRVRDRSLSIKRK